MLLLSAANSGNVQSMETPSPWEISFKNSKAPNSSFNETEYTPRCILYRSPDLFSLPVHSAFSASANHKTQYPTNLRLCYGTKRATTHTTVVVLITFPS